MNGGKPVRLLLALLVGWTVLREAEVGPLRSLLHGPAFGKLAYWIVVVGASLLTLWRARSIRGREGLAWGLIGTGSLLWACGDVYWTLVLAKDAVIPVPSISDAGYLAFYPLVFAGLCLLAARARRGRAAHAVGRWAHRRAGGGRHERRGRPAGRAAHRRRQPARRRHQPRLPGRRPHPARRGRRLLRAAWLARRSHVGPARPGHRALLDRRLLLPDHRRERDLRLSERVGRRLDLVPGAVLGRRLAARAPHGGRRGQRRDALHRLPDRLRHPRPGHPRPRRARVAEPARRRARRRLAAGRLRPPRPEPARQRRDARGQPLRGAHRCADRPGQPPRAHPRPRPGRRRPARGRRAGALRPRRVQALQRLLRPPGRRRPPAAPRSQARRARRRRRLGLPDGRRRVLRASRHRQRIPSRRPPPAPPHSASMATASSSPARSA